MSRTSQCRYRMPRRRQTIHRLALEGAEVKVTAKCIGGIYDQHGCSTGRRLRASLSADSACGAKRADEDRAFRKARLGVVRLAFLYSQPSAVVSSAIKEWGCGAGERTPRGLEPLRAESNAFLVRHLSHSVTVPCEWRAGRHRFHMPHAFSPSGRCIVCDGKKHK